MCVIIITNPENQISKEELNNAWNVNPDGAGFAYTDGARVYYERGFMNKKHYINRVLELQERHEVLLHMRISTGAGVTPQGTHPYKAGNVLSMKGSTTAPVCAMNGIIVGQRLETKQGAKLNDTASYIKDHQDAFKVINQDVLDIISSDTGAKWAAVTVDGVIYSTQFQEYDGRQYSNLNHIWSAWDYIFYDEVYDYNSSDTDGNGLQLQHLLDEKLYKHIKNHKPVLYEELSEYVYQHCQYVDCKYCTGCISDAINTDHAQQFLDANYYTIWEKIQGAY